MSDKFGDPMNAVHGDYQRRVRYPADAALSQEFSGGVPYDGPIVPDGQTPNSSQMRESDFIRLLASELLVRLPSAPPHGEERQILQERVEWAIRLIRDRLGAPGQPIDEFLRQRFLLPSASLTPEGLMQAVLTRLQPGTIPNLLEIAVRVNSLDAEEAAMRTGKYEPTEGELQEMNAAVGSLGVSLGKATADVMACVAMCAPCKALSMIRFPNESPFPSETTIGRLAHLYIQEHYLLTHPGHEIVMESFLNWAGGRTSVFRLARLGTYDQFRALIRFALWSYGRTKLPDIMDITNREVYEIKPRNKRGVDEGINQLCRNYIGPWNAIASVTGRNPIRPGTKWLPSPLYWLPPDFIIATYPCPGLITYDVFRVSTLPKRLLGEPIYARPSASERWLPTPRQLSTAAMIALVLVIIALMATFSLQPGFALLLLPIILYSIGPETSTL